MVGEVSDFEPADRRRHARVVRFLVLVAAALLFFVRLGSTYLWQDEAQTALLGRQILRHGVPLTGKGAASASALAGRDTGIGGLFLHIPPLQAYLAAAGMALFGETALGARFFFTLSGFACVCVLPWAMGRSWPLGTTTAAQLALALHVPFLLFSRQARYYAPAAFLVLVAVGALTRLGPARTDTERRALYEAGLAVALALLALTFEFAYLSALAGTVVVLFWIVFRRRHERGWAGLRSLWPCVPSILLFLSWLWLARTAPSRRGGQGYSESAPDFPSYFLGQVNAYVVPLAVVLVLLSCYAAVRLRQRRVATTDRGGDAFVFLSLLISAVHLTLCTFTTHRFMRYVVPVVPLLVAATVAVLYYVTELGARAAWPRWFRTALMLVLISGLWSGRDGAGRAWLPWERWLEQATGCRWSRRNGVHLAAYVRELRKPPRGPVARVVDYLRTHANPGAVVVAAYGEKPLKFHTRCAVFGGETGNLPPGTAHWIWPRYIPAPWWELKGAMRWIEERLAEGGYEAVEFRGTVDSIWENRPDPEWHVFSESQRRELFRDAPTVRLYRKREATSVRAGSPGNRLRKPAVGHRLPARRSLPR